MTVMIISFLNVSIISLIASNTRGYASHMVLQMEPKRAHVWGFGVPGSQVTLTFADVDTSTTVAETEMWELWIPPQEAGGPHTLRFKHAEESGGQVTQVKLGGVLFGDVWFCFGEGNMEFFMRSLENYEEEAALVGNYFGMRFFHVGRAEAGEEQQEIGQNIEQSWTTINNGTIEWISAECVFFGQMLSDFLPARPIGLIEFAWTATSLQAWLPKKVIQECLTPESDGPHPESGIHNGVVHPLSKISAKGIIWDHGESVQNSLNKSEFLCATLGLFSHWRSTFAEAAQNDLAIGVVQLGPDAIVGVSEGEAASVRFFQNELANDPENSLFTASTFDLVDNTTAEESANCFTALFNSKRIVTERLFRSAKEVVFSTENTTTLKFELSKTDSAQIEVQFSEDIILNGSHGFSYSTCAKCKNWTAAAVVGVSGRRLQLEAPPLGATVLGYAVHRTPCLRLQCAVYDSQRLPLQPKVLPLPSGASVLQLTASLIAIVIHRAFIAYFLNIII
ncbi:sialate O-acetylesterase-like [Neocloeon triangulifer]|uniref:sialate O-acetylesterase-like n=1 Tax=Neocloeon triangulifer TaxID=2078957 RepID=UPI00286EB54D|nr:sialate O-acetylesterase-like [Neocloeon triangulifer]